MTQREYNEMKPNQEEKKPLQDKYNINKEKWIRYVVDIDTKQRLKNRVDERGRV